MNPERNSHPSTAQVETLIEFLERKPSLAKGFSKNQSAKQAANKDWERITLKLNSMGGGTVKTAKKWIKYWSDKKSAVKKKAAARAALRNRTGGGMEDLPELTNIEERIIALMGGEGFATGDRHLQIQPFDEPSQENESPSILAPVTQASGTNANITGNDYLLIEMDTSAPIEQVINTEDVDLSMGHRGQSQDNLLNQTEEMEVATTSSTRRNENLGVNIICEMDRPLTPARNIRRQHQHLPEPATTSPSTSRLSSPRRPRRRMQARRPNVQASPPSQRRNNLLNMAEKFLKLEQQRLDLDTRMVALMERNSERDRLLLDATKAMGEGLKALADAIKR